MITPAPTVGDRIRLTKDVEAINPIPAGTEGTVTFVRAHKGNTFSDWWQANVTWDNGRKLMLIDEDHFEVIT